MNVFRITSIICLLGLAANLFAQNPHGTDLKIDCASCHSSKGWEIDASYWQGFDANRPRTSQVTGMVWGPDTLRFHHGKTNFKLSGRHNTVDCRACHETLVFSGASSDCISCHADVHQQSVGTDCARCHTPANWLVDNTNELHLQNGFPLTGVHQSVSCEQCHTAASGLQFNRIGNDCISCHVTDFQAAANPNHQQAGFSTDCLECHDMLTPDWGTDKVKHDFFPLTKGHEISDCKQCHAGGNYVGTPGNCNACHQEDFDGTQSPSHVNAHFSSNDCATCHTTDPDWMPAEFTAHDGSYFPVYSGKHKGLWSQCAECHTNPTTFAENSCIVCHANPETDDGHTGVNGYVYENSACLACHPTGDAGTAFDHNTTDFPLAGAHLTANCVDCHAAGYPGTPTQCAACHITDYNQTATPNHLALNFPTDCSTCHSATAWTPSTFDHNAIYPFTGAHIPIADDCNACHHGNYTNTPNTCNGCHNADFAQASNPNHVALDIPNDCAMCHTTAPGWEPAAFPTHNNYYVLNGAHTAIATDCASCHNGNYNNTPNTCNGCHNTDYVATTSPNHAAAQYPTDCATCHTETAWAPSTFDHNAIYPFTGAHIPIADDCNACHHGNYTNTPNTCNGCHNADFAQASNPNHVALDIPNDCAMCHTTAPGWEPAAFPTHNNYYVLNGAHTAIATDCASCHNGNYNNTPNTCNGCHNADYVATTSPNHAAAQYPTDCATCHSETAWAPSTFDHNAIYPLTGAHIPIADDCNACHHGNYTNTPNTCNGCHNADFAQASNPNHVALDIPNDCAMCHTTAAGWEPAAFPTHNNYYPLNGAHTAIASDCATCHNGNYNNTPNTCNGCHNTDYAATVNPNHIAAQFPTDCATCHTETTWTPSSYDHSANYPIVGAHTQIEHDCNACHQGNYTNTPNTCNGCHNADYAATTNPNHATAQYPTDCASCHSEAAWTPATFDHNSFYPITGAHIPIADDCNACHNGNYTNTPNTCNGCHNADYSATTSPNHAAAQYPTDCATCHTETAWAPSTFDHNAIYPFTGAHIPIADDCNACHHGNYTNTPNTCNGCHNADFAQASNPNHVALNIPNDCAMCHTTAPGWEPAAFPTHNNYYPLNGAHTAIAADCATCHNGNYNNTPNTCNGCHNADYAATSSPNHAAAQYPTDCATCHTETAWAPSTFDHNAIYPFTGAHIPIADDCNACHHGNYTNTPNTCNGCHNADFAQASNPNHVALNIPNDCAMCHTTAPGWEPAAFPTHNNYYPLNGAHAAIAADCATCHNGNYNNTPNTCNGCHNADYAATSSPNHAAAQYPTDCATCHTETAWAPSTFDHNAIYPFTGAHIPIADDCNACHHGNYTNTPNTCNGCHNADFAQASNPNHVALNIPNDCAMCHTTAPGWEPAAFPTHNNYYVLNGAHTAIASDCATCHNGNYNNTPNTCNGCHNADYAATSSPNHAAAQYPTDCATCHTETAWAPSTFDHNAIYPFTGAHIPIADDCNACHHGNYTNTPNTCNGCHNADFAQASNPNHVALNIPNDCAMCHTTAPGWEPAAFPTHNNYYVLNGAHTAIASDCATCHNGNYNNTPNTCNGCHNADYAATSSPNHAAAQYPTDCATCHTETAWAPSTFDHNAIYPFTGAHIPIADDCNACHHGNYTNTPNTCNGCHNADFAQASNPNHVALNIPNDCAMCHTTAPGWEPAAFPTHNNYYVLNGAHAAIAADCATCHNGNYTNTPNTCNGCHNADYGATTSPNHVTAQFPTDCATCHSETAWAPSIFNHNAVYPFTGGHIPIANDCDACHHGNYTNTPNTCNGCHMPDYNTSTNPNHVSLNLSTNCTTCHTTAPDWAPATFAVHNTYWPLTGAHAGASCNECHANGNYNNTPTTCFGCHSADYNASTNPNHAAAGLPTTCQDCHSVNAWSPSTFNHASVYPFTGAHVPIANDCDACHHGNYTNTPNTCNGCHMPDYNTSTNPNHVSLNLSTNCATCHTTAPDWTPATFAVHNTYWPLTGAHAGASCNECHANGNYNNTPTTCFGCHSADYNSSTNPNHAAAGIPSTCQTCHSVNAWSPATFDHSTVYPFTGGHVPIANDCNACHNGNYTNTPNTCNGCHMPDYNTSTNPNHVSLNLSTNCATCHTTAPDWTPATFAVHNTYWPLTGAHAGASCNECHANGNYNNTPTTCFGCHSADYNAANDPNHASAGFPTTCQNCHSVNAWSPSTFNHSTVYPFTGGHVPIANDCDACHNGNYTNTPNTCNGCHMPDYNTSTNPNHVSLNLSTNCATCHTTAPDWTPATFAVHNTYWPLTGAHASASCNECHANGNYNNTPTTCFGCHSADYNSANDPNHASAGFPTTCQNCHTTSAWTPSNWNHDQQYFPIYSGNHNGEWDDCIECHTTPNNYALFSCINCHEHSNQSQVNNDHDEVSGYQYTSTACYSCHPNGNN